MQMDNLYGNDKITEENKIILSALKSSATRESAHPDDRNLWTPENPTYGHCDLFVEICKYIWARNLSGKPKWKPDSKKYVWWAYSSPESFMAGPVKNKLTVHWSLFVPKFGEIDLSREQFPQGTYLHPRPRPLSAEVPIDRSWDMSSDMARRKLIIGNKFVETLHTVHVPAILSPEFDSFLSDIICGETFGLTI